MNPIIQAYVDFVSTRARQAGYKAFQEGFERRAPVEVGEYAGAGLKAGTRQCLTRPTLATLSPWPHDLKTPLEVEGRFC